MSKRDKEEDRERGGGSSVDACLDAVSVPRGRLF